MLAMHGGSKDGSELLLIVLEPGNLEKLKQGQPIHKYLTELLPGINRQIELVFAYTPDMNWLVERIGKSRDMEVIGTAMQEALSRPEVVIRGRTAEEMKRVF